MASYYVVRPCVIRLPGLRTPQRLSPGDVVDIPEGCEVSAHLSPMPEARQEGPGPKAKLGDIVSRLDQEDDSHWTVGGRPSATVVSERFGARVSRAMIEEVAPGVRRLTDQERKARGVMSK